MCSGSCCYASSWTDRLTSQNQNKRVVFRENEGLRNPAAFPHVFLSSRLDVNPRPDVQSYKAAEPISDPAYAPAYASLASYETEALLFHAGNLE